MPSMTKIARAAAIVLSATLTASAATEHRARIGVPDQRHIDAHDAGGAEPLQNARDRQ